MKYSLKTHLTTDVTGGSLLILEDVLLDSKELHYWLNTLKRKF